MKSKKFQFAIVLFLLLNVAALPDGLWVAVSAVTAMGHTMSPSSQTITKSTSSYQFVATVTDLDTFQRSVPPSDYQLMAGNENDVVIEKNFNNQSLINYEFNATTGERKQTYVFNGPFNLADSGQTGYLYYQTRGVDSFGSGTPERHDVTTNWSTVTVIQQYLPNPGGGGG